MRFYPTMKSPVPTQTPRPYTHFPTTEYITKLIITSLELSTLGKSADLQLGSVFGEDLVVVVLPERFGGVLAGHALEDLCAAGVLVEEGCYFSFISKPANTLISFTRNISKQISSLHCIGLKRLNQGEWLW